MYQHRSFGDEWVASTHLDTIPRRLASAVSTVHSVGHIYTYTYGHLQANVHDSVKSLAILPPVEQHIC